MSEDEQTLPGPIPSPRVEPSHEAQAASIWSRWRATPRRQAPEGAASSVPERIATPESLRSHQRAFAWVACEQRMFLLTLGSLAAAAAMVWTLALRLQHRQPLFVRASESLKDAAAGYYNGSEVTYDQLALFLNACLPLLYAVDDGGHPMLALAQGLVAPRIYDESERRLAAAGKDVSAHAMTQALTVVGMTDVVTDRATRRAAAYVRGYLTVTIQHSEAQLFPWRAQVLVEASPSSRIDRYPFFLLSCEQRVGPEALAWDATPHNGLPSL